MKNVKNTIMVIMAAVLVFTAGMPGNNVAEAAYIGIDKDFQDFSITADGATASFSGSGISLNNNTDGKYARIVYDPDADPGEENKVLLLTTEVGQTGSVFIQIFAPRGANNVTQLNGFVVANYDVRRSAGGSSASFEAAACTLDTGDNTTGINVQFEKDGYIKRSGATMKDLSNVNFTYQFNTWYNVKMAFDINTEKVITVVTRKDDGSAQTHIMDMPDAFKSAFGDRGLARFRATVGVGSDYDINAYFDNFQAYTLDAPQVASAPEGNEVPASRTLNLTFNNPMDRSTLIPANITVTKGEENEPVTYTAYASTEKSYTITLPAKLDYETDYSINISSDVKDIAGQEIAPTNLEFTTQSEPGDFGIQSISFGIDEGDSNITDITETGLTEGLLVAEVTLLNETGVTKSATIIASLYKKNAQGNAKLEALSTAIAENVNNEETRTVQAGFNVPPHDEGEYFVKVMVWDTIEDMMPMTSSVKFDDTGIVQ